MNPADNSTPPPRRPTIPEAVTALTAAGYAVTCTDDALQVAAGAISGNLEILTVASGRAWVLLQESLNGQLHDMPFIQTPNGYQYFYRCSQVERSRQLSESIRLIGTGESVVTFPTPGYEKLAGTLTAPPVLTWAQRQVIVDACLAVDRPEPGPLPKPTEQNADLVYGMMKPTEDNAAILFEQVYALKLQYCAVWGQWLEWNGIRWSTEKTLLAFDYARRMARKLNPEGNLTQAKSSFARGVESFCRASRVFATESADWDKNSWLFNNPADTIDLHSEPLVRYPHRQDDHITKCANVAAIDGQHPHFDKFMQEITLGDESLVNYLQRAIGACLSGAIGDNFIEFWYGTGQNGKSTLGELVEWIFGDYAKTIPIETLMSSKSGNTQHLTFLASLRGIRLAVSSEVDEGSYWNEARLKSLSGDATISANFMRQDPFEFKRTHKHIIYGNHRPMLRVVDPAIKTRLHIVPFKAYIAPEMRDPELSVKLRNEAPQILNWLITGHAQWLEDGYLKKCSAVQAETDSYFEAQSTPEMWLSDCCYDDPSRDTPAKDLYKSFKDWKESRGEGAMSQTRWGEWMGNQSPRFTKKRLSYGYAYNGVVIKPTVYSL